ncbi:hypothetical protein H312_00650 [Anncaliia algerae PRA339]|uniref:Uncharacterized protein n=1 Tax=Anncaliia algerae PRA339 TaxID=1288291 RepID=A0A059F4J3_9MICR|nr:hypothetical protein H312_00650 [Anncaliia algerae PRA339]
MKRINFTIVALIIAGSSIVSYLLVYRILPVLQQISSKDNSLGEESCTLKYTVTLKPKIINNQLPSFVKAVLQSLVPFEEVLSYNLDTLTNYLPDFNEFDIFGYESKSQKLLAHVFDILIQKERKDYRNTLEKRLFTYEEFTHLFLNNKFLKSFGLFLDTSERKVLLFPYLVINGINTKLTHTIISFIDTEKPELTKKREQGIVHLPEILYILIDQLMLFDKIDINNEMFFVYCGLKYSLVSFCICRGNVYSLYQKAGDKWYLFGKNMFKETVIDTSMQGFFVFCVYERSVI